MIDKNLELADKFNLNAVHSTTAALTNDYDWSAASHNAGLSGLRLKVVVTADSPAIGPSGSDVTILVQDAPDSSGSPGTFATRLSSQLFDHLVVLPGTVLLDVGLPLDLRQWLRVSVKVDATCDTDTLVNAYIYTLK